MLIMWVLHFHTFVDSMIYVLVDARAQYTFYYQVHVLVYVLWTFNLLCDSYK